MSVGPTTLFIGGGSDKVFLSLGCLEYLSGQKRLGSVHTYIGSDSGALVALLLSAGYDTRDIVVLMATLKPTIITDFFTQGVSSSNYIREYASKFLINRLGTDPTLGQLYLMTGKTLVIIAYDLTACETVHMSYHTHPNLSCASAVMCSMTIPILHGAVMYQDHTYITPIIHDPYPVGEYTKKTESFLGFHIEMNTLKDDTTGVANYTLMLLHSLIRHKYKAALKLETNPKHRHVLLNTTVEDVTGMNCSYLEKGIMLAEGYLQMRADT